MANSFPSLAQRKADKEKSFGLHHLSSPGRQDLPCTLLGRIDLEGQ
jgi:hypothetical protein